MGVQFGDTKNFYILRYRAQPAMNKRTGEIGVTWQLFQDAESYYSRQKRRWVNHSGHNPEIWFEGHRYFNLSPYMPLTWILKQPTQNWQLFTPSDFHLELLIDADPPGWN